MFSETYTANLRGSLTTLALAAGIVLIVTALFAWRLHRSRRGLPRSSAFALALLALSAIGLTYWWLFFDTYYRMRANAGEIVLQLEMPSREVRIARADGMQALEQPTLARWFTEPFRQAQPALMAQVWSRPAASDVKETGG